MTHLLFSFGTLRQPEVQRSLFGARVPSSADSIVGYRVGRVRITDPESIATSGSAVHPALIRTDDPSDVLHGEALELTEEQLAAAHEYERVSFERIDVRMQTGRAAVAYGPKPELTLEP